MTSAEAIKLLSEIRANYNCFNEKEDLYYHALSKAIAAIREGDWDEMTILCDCCGHVIHVAKEAT